MIKRKLLSGRHCQVIFDCRHKARFQRFLGRQFASVSGPKIEGIGSCVTVGPGRKTVASGAEQSGGLVVDRQEPLRLAGRLETADDLLSPPRVLV